MATTTNQTTRVTVHPILHYNGTSRQELVELRDTAYVAIDKAINALRQMAPNGRDYYPDPGRMDLAVEQHRRRVSALVGIMDELDEEVGKLQVLGCEA